MDKREILTEMIFKLEGKYCRVVGREENYQKLGSDLLNEWEKLSNYYPKEQLSELKGLLENIKNKQVENMERFEALFICQRLLKAC